MTFSSPDSSVSGWRQERHSPTLSEVYRSVPIKHNWSFGRKLLAFAGPGSLVAVGYMDPGNWATSLAGGSAFGYTLLTVILLSNFIAIFLQALALRLGIVTGRDLAQACRDHFSKPVGVFLWLLCEIAICATDLAEVIGTAIALNLLFKIPLTIGVLLTALDVFLLLWLQRWGFRVLEAFIITLLLLIAACYGFNLILAQPVIGDVLRGYLPSSRVISNPDMLYIAIGILGATVMPHNLYLHSAIVQTRSFDETTAGKQEAVRFATWDSTLALMFALFVNSAILILAASVFHTTGHTEVVELQDAYHLLSPLLNTEWAAIAFGVALLACGLNSTATATLAGQIVMEGFLHIKLPPWVRRLTTRLVAVVPAIITILWIGEAGLGKLLILSQVILSLQLPFAILPLMIFVSDKQKMAEFAIPATAKIAGFAIGIVIIALNMIMLWNVFTHK
jgi:manganese transport protein